MFTITPSHNCCFFNMKKTYNFFHFTPAIFKNHNPYSKIFLIPHVQNISILFTKAKITRLGIEAGQCMPLTHVDRIDQRRDYLFLKEESGPYQKSLPRSDG